MIATEQSLLAWLDAPIVVGDPDGQVVYVNPAFEGRFERVGGEVLGLPLAELFEGGAREAVLRAVVSACDQGNSVRFRVRAGQVGFAAVASPIRAEGEQVGVVILFKEEVEGVERSLALHREIQGPLEELGLVLDTLLDQTGGRRSPRHRALLEDGLRALARLRKWSDELAALLSGGASGSGAAVPFDPAAVLRRAADRLSGTARARGVQLNLLVPSTLPQLVGDPDRLEALLLRFAERRLESGPTRLSLGGRSAGSGTERKVLISITEHVEGGGPEELPSDPPVDQEALAGLGGMLHVTAHRELGRTSLLCFSAAD